MKKLLRSLLSVMLVAMMALSFTSCGVPKDPIKAKAKLEKEGYAVILEQVDLGNIGDMLGDKTEANLVATKGTDTVTIIWYKEVADAKAAYDALKAYFDKNKDILAKMEDGEAKEVLKKEIKNTVCGRSGKIVWFGTKAAVKAAK